MKRWFPFALGTAGILLMAAAMWTPAAAQNFSLDLGEGGSTTGRMVQLIALLTSSVWRRPSLLW